MKDPARENKKRTKKHRPLAYTCKIVLSASAVASAVCLNFDLPVTFSLL